MKTLIPWFSVILFIHGSANANPRMAARTVLDNVRSESASFRVVQVVENLEHPWAVSFLPDGSALITERPGRLWLMRENRLAQVAGLPSVRSGGQGGLLDVCLHPGFAGNRQVYISYAADYRGGVGTRVARAVLDDTTLRELEVIFEMDPPGSGPVHFGSRFAFDSAGYLYVTLGERGDRDLSQRLDTHHGKVIRLYDDGRVPDDNPFVSGRDGAHPEIYTYGHRNPQGIVYDSATGRLWLHEHGPRGGDAVHLLRAGTNYGWPLATYGREYYGPKIGTTPDSLDFIQNPIIHWTPSIAPCGMTQLRGSRFAGWEGNLFAGALVKQHIRRLVLDGESVVHQEVLLQDVVGRVRDVKQGHDGNLWFLTDAREGGLYRIEPVEND